MAFPMASSPCEAVNCSANKIANGSTGIQLRLCMSFTPSAPAFDRRIFWLFTMIKDRRSGSPPQCWPSQKSSPAVIAIKKTLLLNQESEAIILRRARLGITSNTLGLDVPLHLQQLADELIE
jgi:hypothetical protein